MTKQQPELVDEVESGDTRRALVALRDHLARELEAAKGNASGGAAIALRLNQVLKDLEKFPKHSESTKPDAPAPKQPANVRRLDSIRSRRDAEPAPEHGTKNAPRQQGGRTPRHPSPGA